MKNKWFMCVLFLLGLSLHGQETPRWREHLLQWRDQREKDMLYPAPRGWLSLVGLYWLKAGTTTFGSASDNQIRIERAAPHVAVLSVTNASVRLLPPPFGFPNDLHVDGRAAEVQSLNIAGRSKVPTFVTEGSLSFVVLGASDRVGLVVDDSNAAERLNYRGLHWYKPDPRYRANATWTPFPKPKNRLFQTSRGLSATLQARGVVTFTLFGRLQKLEAVEEDNTLTLMVRDKTSGRETYGAGRYLSLSYPDHGLDSPGRLAVDFNRLRNPPCAYTPFTNCPLPPRGNSLTTALAVGEKKYRD